MHISQVSSWLETVPVEKEEEERSRIMLLWTGYQFYLVYYGKHLFKKKEEEEEETKGTIPFSLTLG